MGGGNCKLQIEESRPAIYNLQFTICNLQSQDVGEEGIALADELLGLFAAGMNAPLDDERFDRLARHTFAYQFTRNRFFRGFCEARDVTPDRVTDWRQIPAVPTAAFKEVPLTTFPPERAVAEFHTSGTTQGGRHGRHLFPSLQLYEASLLPAFEAYVLPDGARPRMLVAGPPPERAPHSSLTHMFGCVIRAFGAPGSAFYGSEESVDGECLAAALQASEEERVPVCLMGTAFALLHVVDRLAAEGRRFSLAPGSRIMDTGGYKGRVREVPQEALYARYEESFGISPGWIANEYGMTELSSQYYDGVLRAGGAWVPAARLKAGPPWLRAVVVDPETLAPMPPGEAGLVRHVDLANLFSVVAVQTDDLGIMHEGGLQLLGRAAGSEPRGCSLAMEEP